MWQKFIILSLFLSLSSCSVEEVSKGLGDEKDRETIECSEDRGIREDLDTYLQDIEKMKTRASNYEFSGTRSYCKSAQLGYFKYMNLELGIWDGEVSKQIEKLCNELSKIVSGNATLEGQRKRNPDDADVIIKSEAVKKEMLDALDLAKKTAEDSIPTVDNRIKESCS